MCLLNCLLVALVLSRALLTNSLGFLVSACKSSVREKNRKVQLHNSFLNSQQKSRRFVL